MAEALVATTANVARWSFTINNPGTYVPRWDPTDMAYLVFQMERGEENHTLHWQGYVRFKNRKRLGTAKHYFTVGTDMRPSIGNEETCRDYCTKALTREPGHDPHEFGTYDGTKGKKGHRSDLQPLVDSLKKGMTERAIALEHTELFLKYPQGIRLAAQHFLQSTAPVSRDVHTTILWGPTGTGKTHRVRSQIPAADLYMVRPGRDPFSDYAGQNTILFDEFDYPLWKLKDMNLYLDKWSVPLDSRYTNKLGVWNKVYIIANSDPVDWFPAALTHEKASWLRRISEPMGRVFEVLAQDQDVYLQWWIPDTTPPPLATPTLSPVPDPAGAGASTAPAIARTDSVHLPDFFDLTTP